MNHTTDIAGTLHMSDNIRHFVINTHHAFATERPTYVPIEHSAHAVISHDTIITMLHHILQI